MKVYAIRLASGSWARTSYWEDTDDLNKAHFYGPFQLRYARAALTRNKNMRDWNGAEIVEFEAIQGGDPDIEHFKKFYAVESVPDVVQAMARHIEQLQSELQKYRPKTAAVSFVRA